MCPVALHTEYKMHQTVHVLLKISPSNVPEKGTCPLWLAARRLCLDRPSQSCLERSLCKTISHITA